MVSLLSQTPSGLSCETDSCREWIWTPALRELTVPGSPESLPCSQAEPLGPAL